MCVHVVDLIRTYYFTFKRDHVIVVLTYVKKKMYSWNLWVAAEKSACARERTCIDMIKFVLTFVFFYVKCCGFALVFYVFVNRI